MKKNNEPIVHRGEIYYADLSPAFGSEQGGLRPVVIVQNDIGNRHAPTTIIIPLTSKLGKKPLPTHVPTTKGEANLSCDGIALAEQIKVIDKQRLKTKLGCLGEETMAKINQALKVSLGLV